MHLNYITCANMIVTSLMQTWLKADKDEQKQLNKDYLTFVHEQPCEISGESDVVAHHYRDSIYAQHGFPVGMGLKPPAIFCIPLSPKFHNLGDFSIHALGNSRFAKFHNFDIDIAFMSLHNNFEENNG